MSAEQPGRPREIEFQLFLLDLFRRVFTGEVIHEARLTRGAMVDFLIEESTPSGSRAILIEAKRETPQTDRRLREAVEQLKHYRSAYLKAYPDRPSPRMALAIPDPLTPVRHDRFQQEGIDVLSREWIEEQARNHGLEDEAARFLDPEGRYHRPREQELGTQLLNKLNRTPAGKSHWVEYQSLCAQILAYLFCPPLEAPLTEHATASKINRRDMILPNYCNDDFFHFLRSHYRADYIVVDAKNYAKLVGKTQVLQLANYLSQHGAGLFGLIVTRSGADRAARLTQREQWLYHHKMVLVLIDEDLRQMIASKQSGGDPTSLLRQKIEDFRLSI
ncbi:hypothetical protein AB0C28_21655 [Nonomuraea sp. NPDC048892]|uniref:hypothetical protein n=1 Tax=Nonomuraea sp. NPDC048892 TaxID=3154624 RepID=UPI0033D4726A